MAFSAKLLINRGLDLPSSECAVCAERWLIFVSGYRSKTFEYLILDSYPMWKEHVPHPTLPVHPSLRPPNIRAALLAAI